jgi:hypothetical protein
MFFRNRMVRSGEGGESGGTPAEPAAPEPALGTSLINDPAITAPGGDTLGGADTVAGADTAVGADTVAAELKPEDYKLDLPEGMDATDDLLTKFLAGAAKGGMDNESVNAVLKELGPALQARLNAPIEAWRTLNKEWETAVRADPEFAGDKLGQTVGNVRSALELVGTPAEVSAFRDALDMTGAGNHPAIVRMLGRMAGRLVEGGASRPAPPVPAKNPADVFFPNVPVRAGVGQ